MPSVAERAREVRQPAAAPQRTVAPSTFSRLNQLPRTALAAKPFAKPSFAPENAVPGFTTAFETSGRGGGAFRDISANYNVNQANGTGSISLPIPTSASRGRLNPDLSLSYDSGSGNGVFGFGWSLSPIPEAITRKTSDGFPSYGETDRFMFRGVELVLQFGDRVATDVTRGDFRVRTYRPRVDNGDARIEQWAKLEDSTEVHWRVVSSSNTVSIYGEDDRSRIVDDAAAPHRVFSWMLTRSYDSWGNAIEYEYKQEDGKNLANHAGALPLWERNRPASVRNRQKYPKAIRYGNVSCARDVDTWLPGPWPSEWMFHVVMDYGDHEGVDPALSGTRVWPVRQDAFSSTSLGFEVRSLRLCRRILMFHQYLFEGVNAAATPHLVTSVQLDYDESPQRSVLTKCTVVGHSDQGGRREQQSLPAWAFTYNDIPAPEAMNAASISASNLVNVPGIGSQIAEWCDLDGEGLPGLLHGNGSLTYQRNTGGKLCEENTIFQPPVPLLQQPLLNTAAPLSLKDIDRNGALDIIYSDEKGDQIGYYERVDSDTWSNFSSFSSAASSIPSGSLSLDITGKGLGDTLFALDESISLAWIEGLGKDGVGVQVQPITALNNNRPPRIYRTSNCSTFTADMTGDGHADLVEIADGCVTYWMNAGNGSFSEPIDMVNPPRFSDSDWVASGRVHLIDVDGSGTTDIVHLLPTGGAAIYYNQAGNSWSEGIYICAIPFAMRPSSFFTLDILGRGTASICWVDSSEPNAPTAIQYLDLMCGQKPHIMQSFSNGLGLTTTFEFRPSTSYCLDDLAQGTPWSTKLAFPVQCVSKVTTEDKVTSKISTTSYQYHNGAVDSAEQQFAGFEMVETTVSEICVVGAESEVYQSPPILIKSWFNVGLSLDIDQQHFFSPSQATNALSSGTTVEHRPEALRTLRGAKMRSEVFDCETQPHPLQIEEFSYDLDILQPGHDGVYSVTRMTPRTSLTTTYGKDITDPRIEHDIALRCNSWGDIEESMSIVYPRNEEHAQKTDSPQVSKNQLAGNISLIHSYFTNDVVEHGSFRRGTAWRYEDYEIINFPLKNLLSIDAARSYAFASLPKIRGTGTWATLRSEERLYFFDNTLEKRLPAGQVELFSTPDQSFSRSFSPDMISRLSMDAGRFDLKDRFNKLLPESGYVDLDQNDSWWAPSSSVSFDSTLSRIKLDAARRSFYTPTSFKDVFGNTTKVQMDPSFLLIKRMEDPVGNTTTFEYDMAHMIPNKITDANGTSQQVYLDALGRTIATATHGSSGAIAHGDRLDQSPEIVSWADGVHILVDPVGSFAKQCLGNSATRTLYLFDETKSKSKSPLDPPAMIVDLSRDREISSGEDFVMHVEVMHLDGQGAVTQRLKLIDPDDPARTWKIESVEASSFSGQMKRTFQPFFMSKPDFVPAATIAVPFLTTFNDARGRSVATLLPDHTWTKSVVTAWSEKVYDAGNNVNIEDTAEDSDVGMYFRRINRRHYFPSWYAVQQLGTSGQRLASAKSGTYKNGYTETIIGCCGLPIEERRIAGPQEYIKQFAYDYSGNLVKTFDPLNRLVERNVFDGTNRQFYTAGMDDGERWTFLDATSKPKLTWDTRGISFTYVYDKLGREIGKLMSESASVPKLVVKTVYGEQLEDAVARNLRGEVWKVYDQSGVHVNESLDIRRHVTRRSFRLANEYKQVLDWTVDNACTMTPCKASSTFDSKGQLIESSDAMGGRTRTSYNRSGNAVKVQQRHHADDSASQWKTYLTSAQYTADDQPEVKDYGNGITTRYTYDSVTRKLINQRTTLVRKPSTLEDLTITYDCLGREVFRYDSSEQEKFFRNCKIKPQWEYTYDAIGQLVSARGRGRLPSSTNQIDPYSMMTGNNSIRGQGNGEELYEFEESYSYDLAGNIVRMRHAPVSDTNISGWTRNYHYEASRMLSDDGKVKSNRLTRTEVGGVEEAYAYDGSAGGVGCMTRMPGFASLTWNMQGLMGSCSTQRVSDGVPERTYYVYDFSGRRVRKTTEWAASGHNIAKRSRDTIFLDGVEIQRKFHGNGVTVKSELVRSDVAGQELIAQIEVFRNEDEDDPTVVVRYQTGDHLELDDLGQLISYEEYSPFGTPVYAMRRQDMEAPRKYRLAKYEHDEESGLLHCDARYYCPWLGRWTSPDPLGTADGLNMYAYVSNDPINYVDPDGTSKKKSKVSPLNIDVDEIQLEEDSVQSTNKPRFQNQPGRRDGMKGGINSKLTAEQEFDLNKAIKDQIASETSVWDKVTSIFKDNKQELAVKATTYIAIEGLKALPALGTVLGKALDMAVNKWQKDKKLMEEVQKQKNEFVGGSKSGTAKEAQEWQSFISKAIERSGGDRQFKDTMTKAMLYDREVAEANPAPVELRLEPRLMGSERSKDRQVVDMKLGRADPIKQKTESTARILMPHVRKNLAMRSGRVFPSN